MLQGYLNACAEAFGIDRVQIDTPAGSIHRRVHWIDGRPHAHFGELALAALNVRIALRAGSRVERVRLHDPVRLEHDGRIDARVPEHERWRWEPLTEGIREYRTTPLLAWSLQRELDGVE